MLTGKTKYYWCGDCMPKFIDLTGQQFGELTVIERAPDVRVSSRTKFVMWKCRCSCGNEIIARANNLRSGNTRSCGCQNKIGITKALLHDLTGKRYGRLVVLKRADDLKSGPSERKRTAWLCQCDCGNTIVTTSDHLVCGYTTSCGCYAKERASKAYLNDITGQRFGNLTVIKRGPNLHKDSTAWICQCDCGKTKNIASSGLLSGLVKSCGCLASSKSETEIEQILLREGINIKENTLLMIFAD